MPLITNPRDIALRTPCSPVQGKEMWAQVPAIVKELKAVMKAEKGLGVAANQIGVLLRIVVLYDGTVMVNPRISSYGGQVRQLQEACLSIPGRKFIVERREQVKVTYQDINQKIQFDHSVGLDAQLLQHEIDHLNGNLISDLGTEWKG